MKKNKFALGLALLIVPLVYGGGQVYAKNGHTKSNRPLTIGDPAVPSFNERHKTLHSERKAAALRLKQHYDKIREDQIAKHNPTNG